MMENYRINDVAVAMAYATVTNYGKAGHAIDAAVAFFESYSTVTKKQAPSRKKFCANAILL